jgi:hypothetical protein
MGNGILGRNPGRFWKKVKGKGFLEQRSRNAVTIFLQLACLFLQQTINTYEETKPKAQALSIGQ